jgi:hypothetical protein
MSAFPANSFEEFDNLDAANIWAAVSKTMFTIDGIVDGGGADIQFNLNPLEVFFDQGQELMVCITDLRFEYTSGPAAQNQLFYTLPTDSTLRPLQAVPNGANGQVQTVVMNSNNGSQEFVGPPGGPTRGVILPLTIPDLYMVLPPPSSILTLERLAGTGGYTGSAVLTVTVYVLRPSV